MSLDTEVKAIGKALLAMRQALGLKQDDVADAAGITRPMLSAYERGRVQPTLDTLLRLLKAMDSDLITLERYRSYVGPEHPAHGPVQEERTADQARRAIVQAFDAWLQILERRITPTKGNVGKRKAQA